MNKSQFFELVRVNLRYANPQATNSARKKGKNGKTLTRSLLIQYLFSGILFLVLYGFAMIFTDFSKMPGFFTYYVALFSILAFSQGISVIYNIFFESQDLPAYLPLPFQQSTIFLSKILVVVLTVLPFVFPLLIVFLLTGWRSQLFIPVVILLSLLLFVLLLTIIFSLCSLLVFGLTRTTFFKKHKKTVTSLLLVLSMVVAVAGVLLLNGQNAALESSLDRAPIALFTPFFTIATDPFSTSGIGYFLGLVILCLILLLAVKQLILPKLYEQLITATVTTETARRKHKTNQTLKQLFLNYNLQLLKEPNLIMQVFSNSLLMPLIFIITFGVTGSFDLSQMDIRFIGVVFFAGVALAFLTVNQTSFIGNLISLDQENFTFLKTLPLSMHGYLKEKFFVGFIIQATLTGIIALVAGLLFNLSLLFIFCLILGSVLGSYLLCLRYFARDYRLLLLDWTSLTQLFTRGSGSIGLVITLFISMIISVILLVFYGFAAAYLPFWPLTIGVGIIAASATYLWIHHYQKSFWSTFE